MYSSFLWAVMLYADMPLAQAHSAYVVDNTHKLLIPKSVDFVETLSTELQAKTGYHLYMAVVDSVPMEDLFLESPQDSTLKLTPKQKRLAYKNMLLEKLQKPYTLIVFMKEDEKIDIISSEPKKYFDEEKVYYEYMVPLLPKQKDEILTPQLISAIVLNGYAQSADMIAHHFDVKLENNMPVDESGGREFVRFSMYVMLLVMFGIIGVIYLTRKKT
ncbi:hypothetical protein LS74_003305 [Helicobacter magdeburgensis]|uniref:Uncharacterized protein n=1 Tax=Helicobacter magdeburgensis TaxID=471858 RepID=A0A4U8T3Z2_9HELI|nr:hypothetical protein LS74_003305 [Helicobacter magdeburgensis]